DAPADACPAGSGPDVIVLAAATYSLTVAGANEDASLTGDLDITSDVTIVGTGAATTIVRSAVADRVFHVLSTGTLTIQNATIRDGATRFGGGLYNAGALTLEDCVVTANTASGVAGAGGNGGAAGVGVGGAVNAAGGTHGGAGGTGNGCSEGRGGGGGGGGLGGAVFSQGAGMVTLVSTTISGNTANRGLGGAGGLAPSGAPGEGVGGGVYQMGTGSVRLTSTSITGNTSASSNPDTFGAVVVAAGGDG